MYVYDSERCIGSRKFDSLLGNCKQALLTNFYQILKILIDPPSRSQISGATKNCIFCHFWGFWSKTPKNTKNPIFAKSAKIVILVYQRGDQTTFFFVYPPPLNQSLIRGGGPWKSTKMVIFKKLTIYEFESRTTIKFTIKDSLN